MRARRLRHGVVRLGLHRVNQVGKFHRVLDEEHRHVVAHQIPVALVGVELHREAAHVARGIGGATLAGHGGEAHEHRRALARFGKHRGTRDLRQRLVAFEVAMRAGSTRMHDAFGNALVIEVRDLLAQDEVFEQRRSAQPGLEGILVVGDRHALVGGEHTAGRIGAHAVERRVGGIQPSRRRARSHLGRWIDFAQRAAPRRRVARLVARTRFGLRAAAPYSSVLLGLDGMAAASSPVSAILRVAASSTSRRGLVEGPLIVDRDEERAGPRVFDCDCGRD